MRHPRAALVMVILSATAATSAVPASRDPRVTAWRQAVGWGLVATWFAGFAIVAMGGWIALLMLKHMRRMEKIAMDIQEDLDGTREAIKEFSDSVVAALEQLHEGRRSE